MVPPRTMLASLALWQDGRGRVSALRIVALLFLFVPIAVWSYDWSTQGSGARPVNDVIHRTGYWALIFVLAALAITPLARIGRFGQLLDVRRLIGVGAFTYAAAHFLLYIGDQAFDLSKVASEIVLRLYLTIGFTALLGLTALAATSTDRMVRRLGGKRWRRLHQLIYPIALLALVHFFQQTKLDQTLPIFIAGLFGWLMGYRLIVWYWGIRGELSTWVVLALSIVASVLTFLGEAIGIGIAFNVSPMVVLRTAFDFEFNIRPGWLVLAAGLCVVGLDLVRAWWAPKRRTSGLRGAARPPPIQGKRQGA